MKKSIAQLGREVLDARKDYEAQQRKKVAAEERKEHLEAELMGRMKHEQPPDDLGPGYGKVKFTKMKTIRGRMFDPQAAKRYFDAQDNAEGYLEIKPRQKAVNDLVKECIENGNPIPDGIEFTEQPYIRVTKRKK